jgi:hypothetical protein
VPSSAYRLAADAVVVVHAAFVLFVLAGGVLALRWRRIALVHLPAVAWGVLVEYAGWICPLTPLEDELRRRAGDAVYSGDFIGRYLLPLLYPATLTRTTQVLLGSLALLVNVIVYWQLIRRVVSDETRQK